VGLAAGQRLGPYEIVAPLGVGGRGYAVSRDGQRFLVLASPSEAASSPIVVVLGPAAQGASQP